MPYKIVLIGEHGTRKDMPPTFESKEHAEKIAKETFDRLQEIKKDLKKNNTVISLEVITGWEVVPA